MWIPSIYTLLPSFYPQRKTLIVWSSETVWSFLRSFTIMALLLISFLFILMVGSIQAQPSPGYYPSSRVGSIGFNQGFTNLWGPQHQRLDQNTLTLWLDQSSGHMRIQLSFSCKSMLRTFFHSNVFYILIRKWIQVASSLPIWLLWSSDQASIRLHCRRYHITLRTCAFYWYIYIYISNIISL